jgi:hypothetical protein
VFLFPYQIISHVPPAETNVCHALEFYMHVQKFVVASGIHVVLFFTSAVDELSAVGHTHTHSVKYVSLITLFHC